MRVYKGLHDSCLSEMSEMDLACSGLGRLKVRLKMFLSLTHITCDALFDIPIPVMQGQYVFIIYDLHSARIVAARDPMGDEPLFWGTSLFGGKLMFSTDRRLVEEECVDADFFPGEA